MGETFNKKLDSMYNGEEKTRNIRNVMLQKHVQNFVRCNRFKQINKLLVDVSNFLKKKKLTLEN